MKYVSIDVETTGLNPETCQILEFGAVIETDWKTPIDELPTFRKVIKRSMIQGEPYALQMNAALLKEISTKSPDLVYEDELLALFATFLQQNKMEPFQLTVAGQNFGAFDFQFIKKLPGYGRILSFHYRFIDAGNLYFDPEHGVPSLESCLKRTVQHTTLSDAKDVIYLIRKKYENYSHAI